MKKSYGKVEITGPNAPRAAAEKAAYRLTYITDRWTHIEPGLRSRMLNAIAKDVKEAAAK